jgi:hypothetical protein
MPRRAAERIWLHKLYTESVAPVPATDAAAGFTAALAHR